MKMGRSAVGRHLRSEAFATSGFSVMGSARCVCVLSKLNLLCVWAKHLIPRGLIFEVWLVPAHGEMIIAR
jgi:hypothetical protein